MSKTKTRNKKKKGNARAKALAIHEQVAKTIIEHLEKGVRPWKQSWKGGTTMMDLPKSASTGKAYRGSNIFHLNLIRVAEGFEDNQWGTFNIWKKLGEKHAKATDSEEYFGVQKGAKAHPVVFWKRSTWTEEDEKTGDEKVRSSFHPKFFMVFNRGQTNLPPLEKPKKTKKAKKMAVTNAEKRFNAMVKDMDMDFRETNQGRAYYSPSQDYVHLPNRELFKTSEGRCSVGFHEAVHWTGHASRLDRDLKGMFGSEDYAREELVAEMGASMLCMGAGIEDKALEEQMENHAAYLDSWLKAIKGAKDGGAKFINSAASKAQRACELLMPEVFGYQEKKEDE